jgi:hypothetical protein
MTPLSGASEPRGVILSGGSRSEPKSKDLTGNEY